MRTNLKKARIISDISISDICEKLSISPSYYYKIEKGTRNPNIQLASQIATIFNSSMESLFFDSKMDELSKNQY